MQDQDAEKGMRGRGRGSEFFVLGHAAWERLWTVPTTNRLNLIIAYLVLLAGTGADHRLTKWSAKACDDHVGLGKPRARHAIEELIASELIKRTEASTRLKPQYELLTTPKEDEPIFLPIALITGLAGEASMLRRVRETGDALALRMLIDLYGLISLDATHGVPLERLQSGKAPDGQHTARKMAEVGAHAIWGVTPGDRLGAQGEWTEPHYNGKAKSAPWDAFWSRLHLLKQIGAIWHDPWLFDGEDNDAEPIMPLDASGFYSVADPTDEAKLTRLALEAARALVGDEREYLFDSGAEFFVPLVAHRRTPAYREVVRLRVEADTPGRRSSFKKRRTLVEQLTSGFDQLRVDAIEGRYNRPMKLSRAREPVL
ncbi:hypothetical protein [Novosphingopyxis sp.]|uniref:hypothetical protein n=1 Tax=Novosphingopyxis sp. TaxID=2709690 RepID=UPI003B5C5EB7